MIRKAYCRLARPFRAARWAGRVPTPSLEPGQPRRARCASLASACEFDYPFYAHLVARRRAAAHC